MPILRREDIRFQERRRQILARFVTGAKASAADAERWILEWEQRAQQTRLLPESAAYWSAGLRWIASRRELESASRVAA